MANWANETVVSRVAFGVLGLAALAEFWLRLCAANASASPGRGMSGGGAARPEDVEPVRSVQ